MFPSNDRWRGALLVALIFSASGCSGSERSQTDHGIEDPDPCAAFPLPGKVAIELEANAYKLVVGPCGHVALRKDDGSLAMVRADYSGQDNVAMPGEWYDKPNTDVTEPMAVSFSIEGGWFAYSTAPGQRFLHLASNDARSAASALQGGFVASESGAVPWVIDGSDLVLVEADGPKPIGATVASPVVAGPALVFRQSTSSADRVVYRTDTGKLVTLAGAGSAPALGDISLTADGELAIFQSVEAVTCGSTVCQKYGPPKIYETKQGTQVGAFADGALWDTQPLQYVSTPRPSSFMLAAGKDEKLYLVDPSGIRQVGEGLPGYLYQSAKQALVARAIEQKLQRLSIENGSTAAIGHPGVLGSGLAIAPSEGWIALVVDLDCLPGSASPYPNCELAHELALVAPGGGVKSFGRAIDLSTLHAVTDDGVTLVTSRFYEGPAGQPGEDLRAKVPYTTRLFDRSGNMLAEWATGASVAASVLANRASKLVFTAAGEISVLGAAQASPTPIASGVQWAWTDLGARRVVYRQGAALFGALLP